MYLIRLQLQETHGRLREKGHSPNHEFYVTYAGDTIYLRDRSGFDMIDIIYIGDDPEDRRRPATIIMDFAADIRVPDFGVVTFEDDGAWIWGILT
jgi:hypothetical protein